MTAKEGAEMDQSQLRRSLSMYATPKSAGMLLWLPQHDQLGATYNGKQLVTRFKPRPTGAGRGITIWFFEESVTTAIALHLAKK